MIAFLEENNNLDLAEEKLVEVFMECFFIKTQYFFYKFLL